MRGPFSCPALRGARRLSIQALVLTLLVAQTGCSRGSSGTNSVADTPPGVLFLGNSYTSVNNLPSVFATLAASGHHSVTTTMQAEAAATLADHAAAPVTSASLNAGHWSWVVLQEQSDLPALPLLRATYMYPAARQLVAMIRQAGGKPLFFQTWAHRAGSPELGIIGYSTMQAAIVEGYQRIAAEQNVPVAPVGAAWSVIIGEEGDPNLWQSDGSHPTTKGTYLAACVLYAAIFGQSPQGLAYRLDESGAEAARLQRAAAEVVLGSPR